jgi:hypothetical protein
MTNPRLHSEFVVRTSSAKMPSKCWGRYAHVGVIEVFGKYTPALRDTAGQKVRATWRRLFDGSSDRCARAVAERDAECYAEALARRYADGLAAGYVASLVDRVDEI